MSHIPAGRARDTIQVCNSSVTSSAFGNNLRYTALRDAQTDYIEFQFVASFTGTLNVSVLYAMSSSSGNAVNVQLDRNVISSSGGNPSAAATSGTAFNVTPGSNTNVHAITLADSSDFAFSVTEGDIVYGKFTRNGSAGGDTHTGDMRIISVRVI